MDACNGRRSIIATEGALEGIRVLDLTRMLAGPYCSALLADVGAEVIKIEKPDGGDTARVISPYRGGEGGYFMLINRGKKSVTINTRSPEGIRLIQRMVERSDVLIENFKPGVTKEMGLDYDFLKTINPRLIYASISGFGQTGPFAHRPSYDIIAQAMGGLMSITGRPDGPPTRVGESLGDVLSGLYCAYGIVLALQARQRTGEGQHVDVAMLDSIFSLLVTALAQYLYEGIEPTRIGNRHPMSTPFDTYHARDGYVIIAVANDKLFARLCRVLGDPDLARDPRFLTDGERCRHEPELRSIIEAWTKARTVEEVVAELEAASVPASPIWSVSEIANSEHVKFRRMLVECVHPTAGKITLLQQPVRLSGTPGHIQRPPPLLGEHTESVLSDLLGLATPEIDALRKADTI